MNAFKKQCVKLRKQDYTLPEIMKMTGRSKTSVYFHIKNIPLSAQKQKQISENIKQRALRVAASRKGKALRSYKQFRTWTPRLVLLVSHLMFDGEILRKKCVYHNRSQALLGRVEGLMQKVYDYKPNRHTDVVSGVVRIEYNNVELQSFLHHKANELTQSIVDMPRQYQREFVRAFYDDEGCMDYRPDRNLRRVRGYQKDRSILKLIKMLLKNFGIDADLRGKNEVVITGKGNLKKFQKEIDFSNGVRINGKRSNSIWKKDLEKRKILDMAIRSFKN